MGGGWKEGTWTLKDFVDHGWTLVEKAALTSHADGRRSFAIFTKELKKDEIARLRWKKYEPPYLITFHE